jgi:hypothetical protein
MVQDHIKDLTTKAQKTKKAFLITYSFHFEEFTKQKRDKNEVVPPALFLAAHSYPAAFSDPGDAGQEPAAEAGQEAQAVFSPAGAFPSPLFPPELSGASPDLGAVFAAPLFLSVT